MEPPEPGRDKYGFIVQRLRADVRFLLHSTEEFLDMPEGGVPRMLAELDDLPDALDPDGGLASIEPLACLLNFRDRVISQLLGSLLLEKALLHTDLQAPLAKASPRSALGEALAGEAPAVEMAESLAKASIRPERYRVAEVPRLQQPGPFTFDPRARGLAAPGPGDGGAAGAETTLQAWLPAALREVQRTERFLRRMRFGGEVRLKVRKPRSSALADAARVSTATSVPRTPGSPRAGTASSSLAGAREAWREREARSDATKVVDVATIREEITRLVDKCTGLEYELQTAKAQRSETEVLETQLEEKTRFQDEQFELQAKKAGDLESKIGLLKSELTTLRIEKTDLFEKYRRTVEDSLPALDHIDRELRDSQEAVNRLYADAEALASMFRIQVDDNTKHKAERERMLNELRRANRQLKRERDEGQFKDDELQKKETLHRCTVEARQAILDDYAALKETARAVGAAAQRQESELQGIRELVGSRDEAIRELRRQLREAHVGVDYCERQKKFCLQEFQSAVGRPYSMLLEQHKDRPRAKC